MDRFVRILKEKEFDVPSSPPQWMEIVGIIRKGVDCLCVHGKTGIGKSYLVKNIILRGIPWVEMTEDVLRSKSATIDFFDKVGGSRTRILIDEDNLELVGFRELVDVVVNQQIILITTRYPTHSVILDLFDTVEIKPMSVDRMVSAIGQVRFPNIDIKHIRDIAIRSRGNIRTFLISLEFAVDEGSRDIFKTPKEFVLDLVCKDRDEPEDPRTHVCQGVHEHGYTWGVIHENYLDDQSMTIENMVSISDGMSSADILDTIIYSDSSVDTTFALFAHFGIVAPSIKLNHSLDVSKMRPGSSWTKYNNFKMREIKIKALSFKNGCTMYCSNHEHIQGFMFYMRMGNTDLLRNYGLEPSDMDVINHIAGGGLSTKLKTKALQNLKRKLIISQ